jgi:hypothetical protein
VPARLSIVEPTNPVQQDIVAVNGVTAAQEMPTAVLAANQVCATLPHHLPVLHLLRRV